MPEAVSCLITKDTFLRHINESDLMMHPGADSSDVCKITVNERCSIQGYSERVT